MSFPARAIRRIWTEHRGISLVLLLGFAIRFAVVAHYRLSLNLHSDDQGYMDSARWLLRYHIYAYYTQSHSTLHMMPGITLLLAGVFAVFGPGVLGVAAAKGVMCVLGVVGIFGVYLTGRRLFSARVGTFAALLAALYVPGIETDTLLLTETPFFAAATFLFYFVVRAADDRKARYLYAATLCYVISLYFRPTISAYPVVVLVYLLVKRYPFGQLVRQGMVAVALIVVLLCPWWVRNEMTFHKFVPLTSGTGNPLLLGTFQGHGFPAPGTADIEIENLKIAHPELRPTANHEQPWMKLQTDVAIQRIKQWYHDDPSSFIDSYVHVKPMRLWTDPFYPIHILGIKAALVKAVQPILVVAGLLGYLIALIGRRKRGWEILLMLVTFLYYTALYSIYFVYGRYSEPLMPFVMMGIPAGVATLWQGAKRVVERG